MIEGHTLTQNIFQLLRNQLEQPYPGDQEGGSIQCPFVRKAVGKLVELIERHTLTQKVLRSHPPPKPQH